MKQDVLVQCESCECRLNESECNAKQKSNHDECQYKGKELDDFSSFM